MQTMKTGEGTGMPVKVQMANGHTRYGMLLDNPIAGTIITGWKFVSNRDIGNYLRTGDPLLVQHFSTSAVIAIDQYLK